MKPFTITLTHAQANLIFVSLQSHVQKTTESANELIKYIDSEFVKAQQPEPVVATPESVPANSNAQEPPANV